MRVRSWGAGEGHQDGSSGEMLGNREVRKNSLSKIEGSDNSIENRTARRLVILHLYLNSASTHELRLDATLQSRERLRGIEPLKLDVILVVLCRLCSPTRCNELSAMSCLSSDVGESTSWHINAVESFFRIQNRIFYRYQEND